MENEERRSLQMLSDAAKDIMGVTEEIHDVVDNLLEEILKGGPDTAQTLILESVRSIRYQLRRINFINMENQRLWLFGVPRAVLEEGE